LPAEVQEKYQKLIDTGIFASPEGPSLVANDEAMRTANNTAANMIPPAPSGAAAAGGTAGTTGVGGLSVGTLAAIGAGVIAAGAIATAVASSTANEVTLANAADQAANNTVVTPRSSWPTSLNATYSGRLNGTLSDSSAVGGNLSMNVNFATIGSGAPIPGSVQFDNSKGSASLNLVQIGGFVGGGMSGTYNGEAMNGFIRNGQFFGPAANSVKGSWDMSTASVSGGGTFAANR
jgi:hypothetical protein